MSHAFHQYFRCPERYAAFSLTGPLSEKSGYFTFGGEILFGRLHSECPVMLGHDMGDVWPLSKVEE